MTYPPQDSFPVPGPAPAGPGPAYSVVRLSAAEVLIHGPEALLEWREQHRVQVPGHEYMPRFKSGEWDGSWAPGRWCREIGFGSYEMRCSVGHLDHIAADLGVTLQDQDKAGLRRELATTFLAEWHSTDRLREYQKEAFVEALAAGWGRIALATNAGKSVVLAMLAAYGESINKRVLILCDEVAVFDALQDELTQWTTLTPNLIRRGIKEPPTDSLTSLAMVKTLANRTSDRKWRSWIAGHTLVLLDEADKATAASWRKILVAASGSWWRIGFSATFPTELYAALQVEQLMGSILVQMRNADLIAEAVSAKPTVELHSFDATPELTAGHVPLWVRGSRRRARAYEEAVTINERRHAFIAGLIKPDTPTAIIVNRVKHGHALAKVIPGSVFLDGSTAEGARLEALDAFRRGEVLVLIVTRILDRGTNRLGHAADIIFASGEGSSRQLLQRIGRGLRRAGGKEFLRLVDVVDRVEVPADDDGRLEKAQEYLHGAGRRRIQLYADEGFEVEVRT